MREPRLGDIIDDYCVKCKRIMNHAVVSLVNGEPAKVRCRTCHNDHDYRHEQAPPPKVDARKQALFNEVLAKVAPGGTAEPVAAAPFIEDPVDELLVEDEPADDASIEEDIPDEAPPVLEVKPASKLQKPAAAAKPIAKTNANTEAKAEAKTEAKTGAKTGAKTKAKGRS